MMMVIMGATAFHRVSKLDVPQVHAHLLGFLRIVPLPVIGRAVLLRLLDAHVHLVNDPLLVL